MFLLPINLLWLFLLSSHIIIFSSCTTQEQTSKRIDTYPVTQLKAVDTTIELSYVGQISARNNIEIRARISGHLAQILVDEGSSVQQGQVLFKIANQVLLQELAKAEAKQKTAEAEAHIAAMNHKNTLTLAQKNIVSQTEVDLAKAKLEGAQSIIEEAKAEVSNIRLKLSFTEVRAPFGGTINRLPLKMGSIIENGSLLTTLTDNSEIYAYFKLSEHEYLDILMEQHSTGKPNNEVSLIMANGTPFAQKGMIETTESEIDRKTGNIAYRARFSNPQQILKHGATGKVILKRKIHNVILVPKKSTYELQDKVYVMVVDAKGLVKSRKINVLQRLSDYFIVNQGLASDEQILLEGAQKVKDGDQIVPQSTQPTAISNSGL